MTIPTISFSAESAYPLSPFFLNRRFFDVVLGGRGVDGVIAPEGVVGLDVPELLATELPVPRRRIFGMKAGLFPVGVFSPPGLAASGVRTSPPSGDDRGEVRFWRSGADPTGGIEMDGSGGDESSSSDADSSSSELRPSSSNCGPVWLERIVPMPAV